MAACDVIIVGDGAAGIALASLLPGSLVLPSQPPGQRVALDTFAYGAGTRLLHRSPGAEELLRLARVPRPRTRVHRMSFRVGDADLDLPVGEELQAAYGMKMHRGDPPPREQSRGFWTRRRHAAGIEVLDADFISLCRVLRGLVAAEGRILPYEPLPRDPDPGEPPLLAGARRPLVFYTCPPRGIWPSFDPGPCDADKVFLPVEPGPAADPEGRGYEVSYRPGAEVSWHREGSARGPAGDRAVVLEWTVAAGAGAGLCASLEADAVEAGLRPLEPARAFPGVQVRASRPVPRGAAWRPVGRIAELSYQMTLDEVADAGLALREAWHV